MRLCSGSIAIMLAALVCVSCGKTDKPADAGAGPKRSDRAEPRISDLKVLSSQADPPTMSFSLRVELGKGNVSPENCVWVVLADPSVVEQLAKLSENKPTKERVLSASAPGWAAESCTMKADGDIWTGQVKFKDMRVGERPLPLSVYMLDDDGKLSNRLNHLMDFRAGQLRGAASKEDSLLILQSLTKAKVNDQFDGDVEVTDVKDEETTWLVQVQARRGQGPTRTYRVTKKSGEVQEQK